MKSKFIFDSLVFSASRYALVGMSLVRNFVVARVLGPEDYGVWVIVTLVTSYGDQVHLGLRHAGDKELPYRRSASGEHEAVASANALYGGILALSVAASLGVALYGALVPGASNMMRVGLLASAILIFSDQVNRFYLMTLRAYKEFVLSSKVEMAIEALRTVAVCSLAAAFHFVGVLVGFIGASVAMSGYLALRGRGKFHPVIDWGRLRALGVIGSPLFVWGLLYLLLTSADRIAGGILLSQASLGVYGVASLLAQIPVTSSQGVSSVLYPKMSEQLGVDPDPAGLLRLFDPVVRTMALLVPPLVATFTIGAAFALDWFLPAFRGGPSILLLLSNGIYFLCLAPVPMVVLMATGRRRAYIAAEAAGVISIIPFLLVFTHVLPTPLAIGASVSGGFLICTTLLLVSAYSLAGAGGFQVARRVLLVYLPTLLSIALMGFGALLLPRPDRFSFIPELIRSAKLFLACLIVFFPLIIWWGSRTGMAGRLFSRRTVGGAA